MPSPTNEIWEQPPPPRCHYLPRPGEHPRYDGTAMGTSVCGYMVEPYEAAWQEFTSNSEHVTCEKCVSWLAGWTERKLKYPKPGYGR